jgi:methylenetetrahydrofolate--tRNA-(uracil-5-)-methyltransferase
VAAIGLFCCLTGRPEPDFSGETLLGALARHVRTPSADFQPMNANFGILDPMDKKIRTKKLRYEALSARALKKLDGLIEALNSEQSLPTSS